MTAKAIAAIHCHVLRARGVPVLTRPKELAQKEASP
jgi:hypothetical protein